MARLMKTPWFADPAHGSFQNDRRLSEQQIGTLAAWADNGAPEGDRKDAPKPVAFVEGWNIGTPDVVLEMQEEYDVPARRLVGNYPQAFSHVALVNTAHNLAGATKPAEQRASRNGEPASTRPSPGSVPHAGARARPQRQSTHTD